MPFLDRYWWLRVLLACGASVIALAYVVWCVQTGLSIPPQSPFPSGPAVITFAIFIPMLLFRIARYAVATALPSRRRAVLAAIRGDREAVPASLIVPHPERAPNVAAEPLMVTWLPFTFRRSETAPLWAVLGLGLGLLLLITFFMSVGNAMVSYHTFPEIFLHTALSALRFTALGIAFLVVAGFAAAIFSGAWSTGIATPIIAFVGKPFDVVADAEGITTHDLWGRMQRVRWEDARLLELSIAPPALGRYRVFTLYTRDSYVRWRDDTGADVNASTPLDGITREEGAKRLQFLLDLIAARTGLTPRTFDGTLVAERHHATPGALRRGVNMLPRAGFFVLIALLIIFFPPTSSDVLNLLSCAAVLLFAATAIISEVLPRKRSADAAIEPVTPTDEAPQQAHVVYTSSLRSLHYTVLVASLLLCGAALPTLLAWLGTRGISAFHDLQFVPLWPSQAIATLLALFGAMGLVGLVAALVAFFVRPDAAQADDKGLRDLSIREGKFLAWDAVDSITRSPNDARSDIYTVTGNYGRTKITWTDMGATPTSADPHFIEVTPEQFAAIVVARSGKQLTIR